MAIARRNYNVPINEVKRGLVLTLKNRIWQVSDTSFHTQGRRGSHYNVGLKDLQTGKQIVERFNSGSSVDGKMNE